MFFLSKQWFVILSSFIFLSINGWSARQGWELGNGGDVYSSEFILTAKDLGRRLSLLSKTSSLPFGIESLLLAISATEVITEERVFLDGVEKDAVNYPAKKIIKLNRSRWREIRRSTETKSRFLLVLHEYLWISGVNDENYAVSRPVLELLVIKNYSPDVWWNPVNPVNYLTLKLQYSISDCHLGEVSFELIKPEETYFVESKGACSSEEYRKVKIVKTTSVTPPSSQMRGYFHKFEISVFNLNGESLGILQFEPEWGGCIDLERSQCRASGKMGSGGVDLVFWFVTK